MWFDTIIINSLVLAHNFIFSFFFVILLWGEHHSYPRLVISEGWSFLIVAMVIFSYYFGYLMLLCSLILHAHQFLQIAIEGMELWPSKNFKPKANHISAIILINVTQRGKFEKKGENKRVIYLFFLFVTWNILLKNDVNRKLKAD